MLYFVSFCFTEISMFSADTSTYFVVNIFTET